MYLRLMGCTHGKHRLITLPDDEYTDVAIHTGDATHGTVNQRTGAWVPSKPELLDFLNWFVEFPARHHILVPGNHDIGFDSPYVIDLVKSYGITLLIDESITIDGVEFYGTPYTKTFMNWAFMEEEGELEIRYARIPESVDVLITHGPAYGILDRTMEGLDVGSQALGLRLKQIAPKLHVFSHIHEARGMKVGDIDHGSFTDDDYLPIVHMNVSQVDRLLDIQDTLTAMWEV